MTLENGIGRLRESLDKNELWFNFFIVILASNLLSIYLFGADNPSARLIFKEDGLLENSSAIFYFLASFIFFWGFLKQPTPRKFWCLFFAVLFFMVGGEEISWGQRIFGITTPEGLSQINVQNEFNLHNIDGIHQSVRILGLLFCSVFCFLIPISNALSKKCQIIYTRWGVPIFPFSSMGCVVLAVLFMMVPRIIHQFVPIEMFFLDETGEFLLSFAWIPFSVYNSLPAFPMVKAA